MFRYNLLSVFCAFLCIFLSHCTQASAPAAQSPQANTALICHTSHASECYPAIFQPTEDFQRIHDDQSIPPGLHVRLDLTTGLKEARLNVPEPDDAPKADLVLIDSPPVDTEGWKQAPLMPDWGNGEDMESHRRIWRIVSPFTPGFDDPPVSYDGSDDSNFLLAKEVVFKSRNTQSILSATDLLTELAHDLEWGVTFMRDQELSRTLLDYIYPQSPSPRDSISTPIEVRSASAQIVATALQNNPEALEAFSLHFDHTGLASGNVGRPPIEAIQKALLDVTEGDHLSIIFQKRLLFLLANISPSLDQLDWFVWSDGLTKSHLLAVFNATAMNPIVDGRDVIRMKVANYIQDYIISNLNIWPDHSLVEAGPPDASYQLALNFFTSRRAMRQMGDWCQALQLAIDKYKTAAEAAGNLSKEADNAYTSVSEAHSMLDEVLQKQGCRGGCECDLEKTFAHMSYETIETL